MTAVLFVAALGVLGAYVCQLDSLDRARDPLWYMGATYAMFLVTVDSAAELAKSPEPWSVFGLMVSAAWLVGTYFRPVRCPAR